MIEHTKQFLGRRLTLFSHRSCSYLEGLTTSKHPKKKKIQEVIYFNFSVFDGSGD